MLRVHAAGDAAGQRVTLHDRGDAGMGDRPDGERPHDRGVAMVFRVHAVGPWPGKPCGDPGEAGRYAQHQQQARDPDAAPRMDVTRGDGGEPACHAEHQRHHRPVHARPVRHRHWWEIGMSGPEEIIAEDEAGKGGRIRHHGDEHRPPSRRGGAGDVERQFDPMADRLARLFRDFGRAGPQPPYGAGQCRNGADQRRPVEMIGGQDEDAAKRQGGQDRNDAGCAEADHRQRPGVEHGRHDRLAPAFLRVGQEEAAFIDLLHEILLVPDRVAAFDKWNGSDAPILVIGMRQPFERSGAPGIALRLRPAGREAQVHADHRHARREQPCSQGGRHVEAAQPEFFRIGEDAARHAHQPREMHGKEGQVRADEQHPEGDAAEAVGQPLSRDQRPVIIEARKQRQQRTADQHIMEVRDDEIGVVRLPVEWRDRDHHAGEAADDEDGEAARRIEQRCRPGDAARP